MSGVLKIGRITCLMETSLSWICQVFFFFFYFYKSYNSLILVSPPSPTYNVDCILILNICVVEISQRSKGLIYINFC